MKKITLFLLIIASVANARVLNQITDASKQSAQIDANFIDIDQNKQSRLTAVDNYSNQTIAGDKTFTGAISGIIPVGVVSEYAGTVAPAGYLLCDGTSYLRSSYPALFAAIGTAFGSADGTHFNVPDMRGRVVRGVDGTAGNDPDKASRTAQATGGNTGNNVGSVQIDAFQGHYHRMYSYNDTATGSGGRSPYLSGVLKDDTIMQPVTDGTNGTPRTSSETRMKNIYLNYIIKY